MHGHPTKQKQAIYLTDEDVAQIEAEAKRLDRSKSWMVQQAWRIARETLAKIPTPPG